MILSSTLEASD